MIIQRKKSAFRFPNDPEAIIPQHEPEVFIDRRQSGMDPNWVVKFQGKKHKNAKKEAFQAELEAGLEAAKSNAIQMEDIQMVNTPMQDVEMGEPLYSKKTQPKVHRKKRKNLRFNYKS